MPLIFTWLFSNCMILTGTSKHMILKSRTRSVAMKSPLMCVLDIYNLNAFLCILVKVPLLTLCSNLIHV